MPAPRELPKSLTDWEKTLAAYCTRVSLLGEIPLTPSDIDEIGRRLTALLERTNLNEVRRQFLRYRCTWITYMAAIAARNDDRGYWDALGRSLGKTGAQLQNARLGEAFQDAVRDLGLPDFDEAGGYRYVTPIRLHGGIPAYSLGDFFEHIVLPAVEYPDYIDMPPDKCICELLTSSAVQLFVDSPARNYLEFGGSVAVRFFQACREMAKQWEREGDLPPAQQLGLPAYVVRAFRDFMEDRLRTTGQKRLRAPRLLLDPYSPVDLYRLELPPEPVDSERVTWRYRWLIRTQRSEASTQRLNEMVRVRRIGYDQTTDSRILPLPFPPTQLRVEFWAEPPADVQQQAELLGRWTVSLAPAPDQSPLLAFRASGGQTVRSDQALPTGILWLLYPVAAQLEVNGEGRCLQRFPDLLGNWSDWRIEEWDLSKSNSLLLRNGRETWPIAIRGREQEPRLEGGNVLMTLRTDDEMLFYVGEPPRLWLPLATGTYSPSGLDVWRVAISSRWAADPVLSSGDIRPLSHWAQYVAVRSDGIEFPLSTLLGKRPMGTYVVKVEGPHRSRHEFRLRIWPTLTLQDWQPYYLPGLRGAQPVEFGICIAPEQLVVPQPGVEGLTVSHEAKPGSFKVTIAPQLTEAPLFVESRREQDEPVRVALQLGVARLRWMLRLDTGESEWSATPIERPVDALLQSHTSYLFLELHTAIWPTGRIVLIDATNPNQILQESLRLTVQTGQQRIYISLAQFAGTLRHYSDCPVFAFALDVSVGSEQIRLPLLYFKRNLSLEKVHIEWADDGVPRVHWQARYRLRNRRLRLWSAWQPWVEPYEFLIPDNSEASDLYNTDGSGILSLPKILPPGWYWIALRAASPWEPFQVPLEPTSDALLAQGIPAEERLAQLEPKPYEASSCGMQPSQLDDFDDGDASTIFQQHFECACIFDTQGDKECRQNEIDWLANHISAAEPRHILVLYQWLGSRDTLTQRAVRIRMYYPEHFERIVAGNVPPEIVDSYLDEFTTIRSVKLESALLALRCTSWPHVVTHALRILLAREDPGVVHHLLDLMTAGAFSEQDALALLSATPSFSLRALRQEKRGPIRDRLISALMPYDGTCQLIGLGFWLRTEAGWGRIEKIRLADQEMQYFDPQHEQPILEVTLRPGHYPESVLLDLASKTITFLRVNQVIQCRKLDCPGFASASQELVVEDHNRAAHMGLGPAFRSNPVQWRYHLKPQYQSKPPKNLLV